MNLTEKPDLFHWPASHYLFIEKIGPFQTTAQAAWGEVPVHWFWEMMLSL